MDKLRGKVQKEADIIKLATGIFNMIGFINFSLAQKYFVLQRKSLSIRDILSMIDFVQVTIETVFHFNLALAFKHAVNLVIIDGLCLGIDVSGDKQKNEILKFSVGYLDSLLATLFNYEERESHLDYIESRSEIGVNPFILQKQI